MPSVRIRRAVRPIAARLAANAGGVRSLGVQVRRDDRRRAAFDLELDDLRHDLVEDERGGELLCAQCLSSPERQESNPGVLGVDGIL